MTTTIIETDERIVAAWCESCSKLKEYLAFPEGTPITQAILDEINNKASRHESRFSSHEIYVETFDGAPEREIPQE